MADPDVTPAPLDPNVEPLGDEDYKELERLMITVTDKPYQYVAHIQVIDLLRRAFLSAVGERQGLLKELRRAREELVVLFPMKECMWLEWIKDERHEAKTYEDRLLVMEMCGRAVVDQAASTKLWRQYAQFVEEQAHDAATKTKEELMMDDAQFTTFRGLFDEVVVLDTYRQGSEATSIDIADSPQLWDRYRDLLVEKLEKDPTQEALTKVFSLYESRLAVPHANIAETFSSFSSFVTRYYNADYEQIMVKYNKIYSVSAEKWGAREVSELHLKREVDAHRDPTPDEWTIWINYVGWETQQAEKTLDIQMAFSLYERFLLRFGEMAAVWEDYVFFMLEKLPSPEPDNPDEPHDPKVISLMRRATRSCPWSGTLWAQYILALEHNRKPFDLISQVKHEATRTGLLDLAGIEEVVRINIAWCGYLTRYAFASNSNQVLAEDAFDTAEMGIREATTEMNAGPAKDHHYRIPRAQINFYTRAKKFEFARKIWKDLAKTFGKSSEFWLRWYNWELANAGDAAAAKVIERAANTRDLDWPETVLETWKTHVENSGSAKQIEGMVVVYRRLMRAVLEKREAEAAALAEQQRQQQEAERQHAASLAPPTPSTGKRRRSDLEIGGEEEQRAKKSKQEDEKEEPVVAMADQGPPTAAQIAKRDRENCTIIVKNLPPNYPEVKVRQLFRECGQINSLKIINEANNTSSTATVEFDSKDDTLSAQVKDQKVVDDHVISVQIGTGSTLYVTNFPPIADDTFIRDLFKDFGHIVDIRFPSLKYNTNRRFCYVQFASAGEAKAATALHGSQLGEKETLIVLISAPNQKKERSGATHEGREIYIRNIDFSASEAEVKDIFEKYGDIEKIRLPPGPRKGTHKGFGFIVFSQKSAANAACAESGTQLKARQLDVSIASPHPVTTTSNKPPRSSSPAVANGDVAPAAAGAASTATPPPPSFDQIQSKTLSLLSLADTVSEPRLRHLLEPFGPIRKLQLRPNHGGAIVEFHNTADAGRCSLAMEGKEIDGKRIRVGRYEELLKEKPEKKEKKGTWKSRKELEEEKEQREGKVVGKGVLMRSSGREGARRGLGFKGALVKRKEEKKEGGTVDKGGAKKDDAAGKKGKSNDDFKKMFLKAGQ
ncbi:hypothetical protein EX30DRAFT_301364 [Ascodesmis nigricans]|uniref:U4/U6 snRNA-associated-splicing factor PRP24 n=1 Tax=Ascodesmis nigricans TaxID=341454 RepID=A0A4S2N8G0_9PEZI|nr:hypothetical protein EX30DRAFT_301364 [Ascodesmis nigricans]